MSRLTCKKHRDSPLEGCWTCAFAADWNEEKARTCEACGEVFASLEELEEHDPEECELQIQQEREWEPHD